MSDSIEIVDVDHLVLGAYRSVTGRSTAGIDIGGRCRDLDADACAELATFLLVAAGPDAVSGAPDKLMPWPFDGEPPSRAVARLMREKNDAEAGWATETRTLQEVKAIAETATARASLAEKRLAAVLALTTEELAVIVGRVTHEVLKSDEDDAVADAILNLIRSRATEGAEAPTGAAT